MNITIRILGQRNRITHAKRSDGQQGYIRGLAGKPGDLMSVDQMWFHSRNDPKYKEFKEKFFQ